MSKRIFVSSTCYDLVDLRSELHATIESMGLVPVMSDRANSEFVTPPDKNSIETCLENLRRSDFVIVVLSQRYGPSLKAAGYPDVSATHLEYREALRTERPILFYVRDRLFGDYSVWRKQHRPVTLSLPWVPASDIGILRLIDEHSALNRRAARSNWYWSFATSVDLKERVAQDLGQQAGEELLKRLVASGRSPFLIPEVNECHIDRTRRTVSLTAVVQNHGEVPAIHPMVRNRSVEAADGHFFRTLGPGARETLRLTLPVPRNRWRRDGTSLVLEFDYATPDGHRIADDTHVDIHWNLTSTNAFAQARCEYQGKRYIHSSAFRLRASATKRPPRSNPRRTRGPKG